MKGLITKLNEEKEKLDKELLAKNKELEKVKVFIARLRDAQVTSSEDNKK
ncbi:unnamed protein product [marine sediment metagenome]|uniref:Uncharacterized protein n=1 Tax=marine sediment metagenome TaxID=412755 RepID=X1MJ00_9ZZZZ